MKQALRQGIAYKLHLSSLQTLQKERERAIFIHLEHFPRGYFCGSFIARLGQHTGGEEKIQGEQVHLS